MSNTQRTLKALREQGYTCGIVERFIRHGGGPGNRIDFLNIIDIIAVKQNVILGVQSCGQAYAPHDRKLLASENSVKWLRAGGKLELWGWRKVKKKRGGKAMVWKPRVKEYTMEDFNEKRVGKNEKSTQENSRP